MKRRRQVDEFGEVIVDPVCICDRAAGAFAPTASIAEARPSAAASPAVAAAVPLTFLAIEVSAGSYRSSITERSPNWRGLGTPSLRSGTCGTDVHDASGRAPTSLRPVEHRRRQRPQVAAKDATLNEFQAAMADSSARSQAERPIEGMRLQGVSSSKPYASPACQ